MSHGHSGRGACLNRLLGPTLHFGKHKIARTVTDVDVGSGALLGRLGLEQFMCRESIIPNRSRVLAEVSPQDSLDFRIFNCTAIARRKHQVGVSGAHLREITVTAPVAIKRDSPEKDVPLTVDVEVGENATPAETEAKSTWPRW
jgi:hypothetical protein